jgi:hypothetical protein
MHQEHDLWYGNLPASKLLEGIHALITGLRHRAVASK